MRAKITFAAVILMAGTLFSAAAAPRPDQFGRPNTTRGLTVWADVEFRGADHTFIADMPDISSTGMARMISSVRPGPGESWQVCTSPNYQGRCRVFSGAVSNLQEIGWNDVIMSVRRLDASSYNNPNYPNSRAGANLGTATGLELYTGVNFSGRRIVLRESTSDFRQLDFNDRAMSARVQPNTAWEVCQDIEFVTCRVLTDDVADLNAIGISRWISSARPTSNAQARNRGFYQGRGQQRQLENARVVVFEGANFTGRRVTLNEERNSLLGAAGSIQVVGGRWQVCDRPDYGGNCVVVTNDVPDISDLYPLRGRVASLRPR